MITTAHFFCLPFSCLPPGTTFLYESESVGRSTMPPSFFCSFVRLFSIRSLASRRSQRPAAAPAVQSKSQSLALGSNRFRWHHCFLHSCAVIANASIEHRSFSQWWSLFPQSVPPAPSFPFPVVPGTSSKGWFASGDGYSGIMESKCSSFEGSTLSV